MSKRPKSRPTRPRPTTGGSDGSGLPGAPSLGRAEDEPLAEESLDAARDDGPGDVASWDDAWDDDPAAPSTPAPAARATTTWRQGERGAERDPGGIGRGGGRASAGRGGRMPAERGPRDGRGRAVGRAGARSRIPSLVTPAAAGPAWLERWFLPVAGLILLAAAALRLPELALNPFHHDEGVNGYFETNLFTRNSWAYDPRNYHGPTLYYLGVVTAKLFGLTTEAMRLVPVLAGMAVVALVLPLRRYLGPVAALAAAALLAVSPGMVYVSRYFIHEMPLVAFTLGMVVSALLYLERGRPAFLYSGAACAALMFATKETGVIAVAVLLIAGWLSGRYATWRNPALLVPVSGRPAPRRIVVDGVEYRATGDGAAAGAAGSRAASPLPVPTLAQVGIAALVFVAIWVVLFTSLFTNLKGLTDSVATFAFWLNTSGATQVQPVYRYIEWMARGDTALLALGVAGGIVIAIRPRDRFSVFVALWAAGMTAAYSIPQYKTPWIAVNLLVPLALLAGVLLREVLATASLRRVAPVVLALGLGVSTYQAVDLNYVHYDDETYPYVFVHTTRQALELRDMVHAKEAELGLDRDGSGAAFFSPDYWPLPWYLPKAEYWAQIYEPPILEGKRPMVIVRSDQEGQLSEEFKAAWARSSEYQLRPGVRLVLYLRRDAFGL